MALTMSSGWSALSALPAVRSWYLLGINPPIHPFIHSVWPVVWKSWHGRENEAPLGWLASRSFAAGPCGGRDDDDDDDDACC
ncbi:hypothetical protein IWX47DRAFT_881445 [Phyllosticta citricarpa]